MLLDRKAILSSQDAKTQIVSVPEWGGDVRVRVMTGEDRDAFEAATLGEENKQMRLENFRARWAAACICDDAGNRLFTDADIAELGKKSGVALDRVFDVALHLNKMGKDDVEQLVKN